MSWKKRYGIVSAPSVGETNQVCAPLITQTSIYYWGWSGGNKNTTKTFFRSKSRFFSHILWVWDIIQILNPTTRSFWEGFLSSRLDDSQDADSHCIGGWNSPLCRTKTPRAVSMPQAEMTSKKSFKDIQNSKYVNLVQSMLWCPPFLWILISYLNL